MSNYKKFDRKKKEDYYEILQKEVRNKDDVKKQEDLIRAIKNWEFESVNLLKKEIGN
jgi:hypothetical protein